MHKLHERSFRLHKGYTDFGERESLSVHTDCLDKEPCQNQSSNKLQEAVYSQYNDSIN